MIRGMFNPLAILKSLICLILLAILKSLICLIPLAILKSLICLIFENLPHGHYPTKLSELDNFEVF